LVGYIERIVAVADTHDYGAHMAPKIAAAQAPAANFSRPIAALITKSAISVGMDVATVNTRLHAAAVPLEQRIGVKAALVRAGWLPRADAPGTVHAGQGDMRMPRQVVQLLERAKLTPPPAGKALKVAHVDSQMAAAGLSMAERMQVKVALKSAGQIQS
jgi:hypothetical protein